MIRGLWISWAGVTVLMACCGPAGAQVRLDLRLVPQAGTLPGFIIDRAIGSHDPVSLPGQVRRFEVQYRITDLNPGDSVVPDGLSGMVLRVCAAGTLGSSVLRRAPLSSFEAQLAGVIPPDPIDSTGWPSSGVFTGLHRPFRGGLTTDGGSANGAASGGCINAIVPLSVSSSGQGNPARGGMAGGWYGLYSFELVAGEGACDRINISATAVPDGGGVTFSYYRTGNPFPVTSSNSTNAASFVDVSTGGTPNCLAVPVCPEDGDLPWNLLVRTFPILGAVTGEGWYWRIESDPSGTPFQSMTRDVYVRRDRTNQTTRDVADDFAASINEYFHTNPRSCSATQITAVAINDAAQNGFLGIRTAGTSRARLYVGTDGAGAAGCLVEPAPVAPCSFQPSITRLDLPGADSNGNGVDDVIDISTGNSLDANGNGVPDESEAACPLHLTGLPRAAVVDPGAMVQFATGATGAATIRYFWRKNAVPITNGPTGHGGSYSGANSAVLTITNASLGDGGQYDCVVNNPCATLVAAGAVLVIDCGGDYNRSGIISVQDIFDFLADYFGGVPWADVNGSGTLSVQDMFDFLAAYFAACG